VEHPHILKVSRLNKSRAYRKAKRLVSATINSSAKLLSLSVAAQGKLKNNASQKISELLEPINTSLRLVRAYANGRYRSISLESFGLIIAAIIYFVMPIDSLPDFILLLGFTDDAAVLAWTFKMVSDELEQFRLWEKDNPDEST